MRISATVGAALASVALLQACDDTSPPVAERVRAIKYVTVTEPAGGTVRRYAGSVEAAQSSSLSFAVPGTVTRVEVVEGARVKAGQLLAVLDTTQFELDLQSARSQLASSQAKYNETRLDRNRKQELYKKGWVAKAAVDSATAAAESALSSVEIARSQVGHAERNLEKTRLTAPFDGVIASRSVEPFTEVGAGVPVFEINASAGLEVEFSIPDGVVNRISLGQQVDVSVSNIAGCGCTGRIIEIGSVATAANTVSVTTSVETGPPTLLPGMAAEARLVLSGANDGDSGFLVPLAAIVPGADSGAGFVFKYDANASVVRRTPIKGGEGRDNLIAVREGLEMGDIIAVAGVSFLRDGQKVKLLGE